MVALPTEPDFDIYSKSHAQDYLVKNFGYIFKYDKVNPPERNKHLIIIDGVTKDLEDIPEDPFFAHLKLGLEVRKIINNGAQQITLIYPDGKRTTWDRNVKLEYVLDRYYKQFNLDLPESDEPFIEKLIKGHDEALLNHKDNKDIEKGGIDLNPNNLDLQTQGQEIELNMPFDAQTIVNFPIDGFAPVIIQIVPANLPLILESNKKSDGMLNLVEI